VQAVYWSSLHVTAGDASRCGEFLDPQGDMLILFIKKFVIEFDIVIFRKCNNHQAV
jgi:hypothetical protein